MVSLYKLTCEKIAVTLRMSHRSETWTHELRYPGAYSPWRDLSGSIVLATFAAILDLQNLHSLNFQF